MLFFAPKFLILIVLAIVGFYLTRGEARIWLLLIASLIFAALVHPFAAGMLLLLAGFNYRMGAAVREGNHRSRLLWIGIVVNAAAILMAKMMTTTGWSLEVDSAQLNYRWNGVAAFIGLTFYGMQNIAYLIESYWRTAPAFSNWLHFNFYTAFFPKLASGPIEEPKAFQQQISLALRERFQSGNIVSGLQRILLGLFKKLVIADRLAITVHSIFDFNDPTVGLTTLVGAFLFTIQVYFDFSGYMDIALGIAKLMGFKLKENFNYPLAATSVAAFWRRWHITLIDWLTRYIYYPISIELRKNPASGAVLAIFLTFFVSGIWHGIGINFILYAMCHFVYLTFEYFTKKQRKRLSNKIMFWPYRIASIAITFIMVSLAFIFFRSPDFHAAMVSFGEIFSLNFWPSSWLFDFIGPLASGGNLQAQFNLLVTVILALLLVFSEKFLHQKMMQPRVQVGWVSALVLLIFTFGVFDAGQRFIYIQF